MTTERISAYYVNPVENDRYMLTTGEEFDPEMYSRVKYGDNEAAITYGDALAEALIEKIPEVVEYDKAVLTVPSFVYAPKPASAVARAALTQMNVYRTGKGIEPIKLFKLYANGMGTTAYAQSSLADREAQLNQLHLGQYHIPPTLVEDAVVFAVDDCIITGSTERKQVTRIAQYNPAAIICAYAVEVDPEKAKQFPGIEHRLNMAANPDLGLVKELIDEGKFELNSRVLDMILGEPDADKLQQFLHDCPNTLVRAMYEATVNSSIEFIERYKESTAMLTRRTLARA